MKSREHYWKTVLNGVGFSVGTLALAIVIAATLDYIYPEERKFYESKSRQNRTRLIGLDAYVEDINRDGVLDKVVESNGIRYLLDDIGTATLTEYKEPAENSANGDDKKRYSGWF